MLVLSRKEEQSIIIGRDIVVMILEIRGDSVRLGITAPREVAVHRHEVAEVIYEQAIARGETPEPVPMLRRNGHSA